MCNVNYTHIARANKIASVTRVLNSCHLGLYERSFFYHTVVNSSDLRPVRSDKRHRIHRRLLLLLLLFTGALIIMRIRSFYFQSDHSGMNM